jgi:hypothetical protein
LSFSALAVDKPLMPAPMMHALGSNYIFSKLQGERQFAWRNPGQANAPHMITLSIR